MCAKNIISVVDQDYHDNAHKTVWIRMSLKKRTFFASCLMSVMSQHFPLLLLASHYIITRDCDVCVLLSSNCVAYDLRAWNERKKVNFLYVCFFFTRWLMGNKLSFNWHNKNIHRAFFLLFIQSKNIKKTSQEWKKKKKTLKGTHMCSFCILLRRDWRIWMVYQREVIQGKKMIR